MRSRLQVLASTSVLVAALAAVEAAAQAGGPTWVALDTSNPAPPGTPATFAFDPSVSTTTQVVFDVSIHGFWLDSYVGPDLLTYRTISIPGDGASLGFELPSTNTDGDPDLPIIVGRVASPPGTSSARLLQASVITEYVQPGFGLLSPVWHKEVDHGPGTPGYFVRNEAIYSSISLWPSGWAQSSAPITSLSGPVAGCRPRLHPVRWNPTTQELRIARQLRVTYEFLGTPQAIPPITKERWKLAQAKFQNWSAMGSVYLSNDFEYEGEYLILVAQELAPGIGPFVEQKLARGFRVQVDTIPNFGSTCASIQALIQDWYASTPSWRDHYALLVGDGVQIPPCYSPPLNDDHPAGVPSEDAYASTDGPDLDEEIFLGRIAPEFASSTGYTLEKILGYMDSPPLTGNFDEVLLVAHEEDAPGKYVEAHEKVRTATYSVPPTFTTLYGHVEDVENFDVRQQIEDGLGLVAYRGHGSAVDWYEWTSAPTQSFGSLEVGLLQNGPMTPVVWSFSCQNGDFVYAGSIGNQWLEWSSKGAVSHYGSTVNSYTDINHELNYRMFQAVYDFGLTTQSHAIEVAEELAAAIAGPENAWMYCLLGDPDMQIRRRSPLDWDIVAPPAVPPCETPPCNLTVQVNGPGGDPMPGVLVAAWKPDGMSAADRFATAAAGVSSAEVFANRYTDATGMAVVPAEPTTVGWMYFTVQDDEGNSILDSVYVGDPTSVELPATRRLVLRAAPSVVRHETTLDWGAPLLGAGEIRVYDVAGHVRARVPVAAGERGKVWEARDDGGGRLPSGVYIVRLRAGGESSIARIAVLR